MCNQDLFSYQKMSENNNNNILSTKKNNNKKCPMIHFAYLDIELITMRLKHERLYNNNNNLFYLSGNKKERKSNLKLKIHNNKIHFNAFS